VNAPFNANAPFFLDPGASSGPFELFDVIVDPSAAPATYGGNSFSISGGTFADFSDLAARAFSR